MNKYILFCCFIFLFVVAYGVANDKSNISDTEINELETHPNVKSPTINALVLGEHIDYNYKLTSKDQSFFQDKYMKLVKCLKKDGVIPIGDWHVEETTEYLYFISRVSFIPENNNTTLTITKPVCKSHVLGSKYTSDIVFNNNGRDPIINKGKVYFSGIEIGFIVKVYKGKDNDGKYGIMGPDAYIKKAKVGQIVLSSKSYFE